MKELVTPPSRTRRRVSLVEKSPFRRERPPRSHYGEGRFATHGRSDLTAHLRGHPPVLAGTAAIQIRQGGCSGTSDFLSLPLRRGGPRSVSQTRPLRQLRHPLVPCSP